MIRYENECCGCASPNYPCRGPSCPLRHVPHLICEGCGDQTEVVYRIADVELCYDCFLDVIGHNSGVDTEDDAAVEKFIIDEDIRKVTAEEVDL